MTTRSQRRRLKQKGKNLCTNGSCISAPKATRTLCEVHAAQKRKYGIGYYYKRRRKGLCRCGALAVKGMNSCETHRLEVNRQVRLKQHNLTEVEFAELEKRAGGLCMICEEKTTLVIDHDHKTGHVRGLLCNPCNVALGYLQKFEFKQNKVEKYLEDGGLTNNG